MGTTRLTYKLLLLLSIVFLATPVTAQVPELETLGYKIKYDVAWNGMGIGRIRLTVKEDRFGYTVKVDTKTKGIMRMFSSESRIATAKGHNKENGAYVHTSYASTKPDSDGNEFTTLRFNSDGKLISRERFPEDKRRAPVSNAEASAATDPVTALLEFRRLIHRNISQNVSETALYTYDGARLAEMKFKVVSRARVQAMGEYKHAINSVMSRKPIKGYHEKEMKKYNEGDPTVHAYWSADGSFIPLKIEIPLSFGTITATISEIEEF